MSVEQQRRYPEWCCDAPKGHHTAACPRGTRQEQLKRELEHWRAQRRTPDLHTCWRGPICGTMAAAMWLDGEQQACWHASCHMIEATENCRACWDESQQWPRTGLDQLDDMPWPMYCPEHGWTMEKPNGSGSGRGFAGGTVWWVAMQCGCVLMDESDDLRAAR